ncbi:RNA polymerase sigma factor [Maribacter polysaccharolyticus]|uniref:RNA polymerase sigma factor n=1 Tax=Maribacter polysaccharolyticus TaxID=3020831 RepID=UPI00237F0E36|nr:sigma-70 family RNA polymerase sigma factor [Maribacter polysaccharolyticus]MDE3741650.1 sigma-70 family RNA polymerase sigma factor [Maribacter polysaccharolyticus]
MQKQRQLALATEREFGINTEIENDRKGRITADDYSEKVIWKNLKNGDKNALGLLYNLHIDELFSYGICQSQDRNYVMDCIHDLFVDLFKYRKSISIVDDGKYYLFKSLKRKINRKYKRKTINLSQGYEFLVTDNPTNHTKSHEDTIINAEHRDEKKKKLDEALNQLSKKQREGLFLRYNQEKSYEEISKIMGVSVETARTTVYRALKSLRP